jgi:hypothetical protein
MDVFEIISRKVEELLDDGDHYQALQYCTQLVAKQGIAPSMRLQLRLLRLQVLVRARMGDAAVKEATDMIRVLKDPSVVLFFRSQAYKINDKYGDALKDLRAVKAAKPDFPDIDLEIQAAQDALKEYISRQAAARGITPAVVPAEVAARFGSSAAANAAARATAAVPTPALSAISALPLPDRYRAEVAACLVEPQADILASQQRFNIARLQAQASTLGLRAGHAYCLVPTPWWRAWCAWVGGFSQAADVAPCIRLYRARGTMGFRADETDVQREYEAMGARSVAAVDGAVVEGAVTAPGPIDTRSLLAPLDAQEAADAALGAALNSAAPDGADEGDAAGFPWRVREGLLEGEDFELLPRAAVRALSAWHGRRGPLITRRVVPIPSLQDDDDEEDSDGDAAAAAGGAGAGSGSGAGAGKASVSAAAAAAYASERKARKARKGSHVIDIYPHLHRYERQGPVTAPEAAVAGAGAKDGSSAPAAAADKAAAPADAQPTVAAAPIPAHRCSACATPVGSSTRCSACKQAYYCSERCQRSHWPHHKVECKRLQAQAKAKEEVAAASAAAAEQAAGEAAIAHARSGGTSGFNGLVGLVNMGNTCFMNSGLQALSATWPLTSYFLANRWQEELNTTNPMGTKGKLATAYAGLLKELWFSRRGSRGAVVPMEVKRAIGRFQERFSGFAQHDAQELLNFLLDGLHEDLNRVLKKEYVEDEEGSGRPDALVAAASWEKYQRRNRSIVVDTFAGQLKSTLVCPQCEKVSVKFDPFHMLSLPLPTSQKRTALIRLERLPYDLNTAGGAGSGAAASTADGKGSASPGGAAGEGSNPCRWLVPSAAVASADVFASCTPREAPLTREHRYEVIAVTVDKADKAARVFKAAIAGETGVPQDRWMLYKSRGSGDLGLIPDSADVASICPRDLDQTLYAVELCAPAVLPPADAAVDRAWSGAVAAAAEYASEAAAAAAKGEAAAERRAAASAAAGGKDAAAAAGAEEEESVFMPPEAAAAAASAIAHTAGRSLLPPYFSSGAGVPRLADAAAAAAAGVGSPAAATPADALQHAERVLLLVEHQVSAEYGLAGEVRAGTAWDPPALDVKPLLARSDSHGQPTIASLPRCASVAQARMLLARAIIPVLDFDAFMAWARVKAVKDALGRAKARAKAAVAAAAAGAGAAGAPGGEAASPAASAAITAAELDPSSDQVLAIAEAVVASDGFVLLELARRLPLAYVTSSAAGPAASAVKPHWLPTFETGGVEASEAGAAACAEYPEVVAAISRALPALAPFLQPQADAVTMPGADVAAGAAAADPATSAVVKSGSSASSASAASEDARCIRIDAAAAGNMPFRSKEASALLASKGAYTFCQLSIFWRGIWASFLSEEGSQSHRFTAQAAKAVRQIQAR